MGALIEAICVPPQDKTQRSFSHVAPDWMDRPFQSWSFPMSCRGLSPKSDRGHLAGGRGLVGWEGRRMVFFSIADCR
jgi:hypothetical protein